MSSPVKIQHNISLKNFTTFKIGGPADFFVSVQSIDELKEALHWAQQKNMLIFILGGGSNLLVSDFGFRGLVIKMNNEELKMKNDMLIAGAGINLNTLIKNCWSHNLFGLENLAGIYGTLGGAVRGNAGAYGSQMADFIEQVTAISRSGEIKIFSQVECKFNYRSSIFKANNLITWSVKLKLMPASAEQLATAQQKVKELLAKRRQSQPSEPSAGCVFKNVKKINEFIKDNPNVKLPEKFLANSTIPAGWLIEQVGLKGQIQGGAQISEQHANFIVNFKDATAQDVVQLISLIKNKVKEKFKIDLEEEIEYLGF